MGASSSKPPSQVVGSSYYANLAMAVGSKVDKYLELWIDNNKVSDLSTVDRSTTVMTGEKSSQYPSNAGRSKLMFYYGNNTIANSLLTKLTGYAIKYKRTAYVVFYDAFLGDNVRSVPNYRFKVRRTNLLGWTTGEGQLDDINGEINPAVALYYMMTVLSRVPEELINKGSFTDAAVKLKEEQFGLSFNISTSDEAKKWSSEILRTIDGSLFFDTATGQYVLRLLRDDYDVNDCISIDDSNSKDISYNKNTWANTATEVTLEYTNSENFEPISINKTNTTTEILAGTQRNKVVKMMAITNDNVANNVLNRQLQKYTLPIADITLKIPSNINIRPLDVIKFSNNTLGIENMLLRVLEIGGDSFDKEYYEIKCAEDIFSLGEFDATDVQQPIAEFLDYNINSDMGLIYDHVFLNKDITKYNNVPSMIFLDNANDNSVVTYDTIDYKGDTYTQNVENYSSLASIISKDDKYFVDEIIVDREPWMEEFTMSDADWQLGEKIIIINKEIFSVKKLEFIDDDYVKATRLLRNINNINIDSDYNIGDRVWVLSNDFKTLELDNIPEGSNIDLNVRLNNRINTSNDIKVDITYEDLYNKPYPVEFIQYNGTTLSWYPTYFEQYSSAATYSDPDLVVATNATENIVGVNQSFRLEVTYQNNSTEELYSSNLNIDILNLKEVNIYNIINNKESNGINYKVGI